MPDSNRMSVISPLGVSSKKRLDASFSGLKMNRLVMIVRGL